MALRRTRKHAFPLEYLLELVLLAIIALSSGVAQEVAAPDTLRALQPDTLRALLPDSLRAPRNKSRFIPFVGNLERSADSLSMLHSTQFIQSDAMSATDLLRRVPGVFIRELGQPGQPSQLNVGGISDQATALLLDGRALRDPITGSYNLYDIPIEFIDEIEMENSSASLFAAPNSAGGAINFVSHQYDDVRPMTKLRFVQGPFDHILTDGVFAQNVSRGMNAMFGFQRLVTDGRYPNSKYDSWNIRTRLRYNITEQINAWVSDYYNKSTTGLNGGIDPSQSLTLDDELTAVVRDATTAQTISRHDVTLGLVGKFLPDSTSRSKMLVYYSMIDREYSTGATQSSPPTFTDIQNSSLWGAKLEQQIDLSPLNFEVGAEVERRIIQKGYFLKSHEETYTAAKGRAIIRPLEWLTAEGATRFESLRNDNALSWSMRLQADVADWFSVWGGASRNFRCPTIQELFWADSSLNRVRSPEKETHSLLELGFRIKDDPLSVSVRGFNRRIDNAIVLTHAGILNAASSQVIMSFPQVDIQGVAIDLSIQLWRIALTGNFTYTDYRQQGNTNQPFPRFMSLSELSYRDVFGDHVVDLKVAVRLRAISHHYGLRFIPQQLSFTQQNSTLTPGFSAVDCYIVAKLGDAHVTFVWENPFNVNSMFVPYYPLLGRNIKLGVNWVFTD